MTTDRCDKCGCGWFSVYKSRRSVDGSGREWQTQYLACWNCNAKPDPSKRVVPAKPPKKNRRTIYGTDTTDLTYSTNTIEGQ